jgi:hypothetical protein
MKLALSFALVLCGTAVAQTPDNAASDSLRQRMLSMNLLNPPKRVFIAPVPIPAPASKICAVPLLNAPVDTTDKMHVLKPVVPLDASREIVLVPAPACSR